MAINSRHENKDCTSFDISVAMPPWRRLAAFIACGDMERPWDRQGTQTLQQWFQLSGTAVHTAAARTGLQHSLRPHIYVLNPLHPALACLGQQNATTVRAVHAKKNSSIYAHYAPRNDI